MIRTYFLSFVLVLAVLAGKAQDTTPTADAVMKLAYKQAGKQKKNVFVMFHASWCGWCKKMDKAMQDESCKTFFDNNFVISHLTMQERGENKKLENEGADALLEKWGGKNQGLPFWVILNEKGEMLANGLMENGENTGCPASPEEVEAFVKALQKTTKIDEKTQKAIQDRFKKNAN
jgi:thioredoxin-related protein